MKTNKNGFKTVVCVNNNEIKKIRLLYGTNKKLSDWYAQTGADIICNGAFFNTNGIPIEQYKSGGRVYSQSSWCTRGFGVMPDGKLYFGDFTDALYDFTSGFPVLVENKEVNINFMPGGGLTNRHPRTALALTDTGILLVTIDGRRLTAPGMTLDELAAYIKELGAIHAINLDGGGSTHLLVNGKTANSPCEDRKVSNIVAIWLKNQKEDDNTVEKKIKIFIDAGHNNTGADTGAVYMGAREQDISFNVAQNLSSLLRRDGYDVMQSRTKITDNVGTDLSSSIKGRYLASNNFGADLFVSIHCNAGGGTGTEALVYKNPGSASGVAETALKLISQKLSCTNRGIKARPDIGVLKNTVCPAMVIELGFMDNINDLSRLKNKQDAYADAIYSAIKLHYPIYTNTKNRYSYDNTVNNMICDGIITKDNMQNWEKFLDGRVVPKHEYIRTVLDKYHELL